MPALIRRCGHHERMYATSWSSFSYYPVTASGQASYRRGACRQLAHSPGVPLPAVTAAGNTHPPSPTAVGDSVPHTGERIFQTADTAGCALHT